MHEQSTAMRVFGYVRVSSDEQADSRLGLESQRAAIERACALKGYALRGFYEDAGLTGSNTRRPALQEALGAVQKGDGLMVSKLCRLSRSVHDFAGLVKVARSEGWSPIVLDPDLDLATPNGRLVANMLVAVAQWECEIIGQRTREALAAKRARGEPMGAVAMIGERLAGEILEMRATMTYREICADLNRRAVPTPRGGLTWRPSSLQGLLRRVA